MPLTKEQLLVEVEDLLRNSPTRLEIVGNTENGLSWYGRFSAVIRAWDLLRGAELLLVEQQLAMASAHQSVNGYRRMLTLLHEARHALRLETVGPLSVAVAHGEVFDYFDELRRIVEMAKQDLLFVDPYLDAEFVSRYLGHVSKEVTVRLLARSGKRLGDESANSTNGVAGMPSRTKRSNSSSTSLLNFRVASTTRRHRG